MQYKVDGTESAFAALGSALTSALDGSSSPEELRNAVRLVCVHAHSDEIPAEQLLVRFKNVWSSLPQVRSLPLGRQENELMTRVVTLCIEEFYGALPMSGDGGVEESLKRHRSDGDGIGNS